MKTVVAVFACLVSSIALAVPPPAPVITVGVTDVRQLEFNWAVVPRVQTYELWYQSAPGATWAKYAEKDARYSPIFRIGVPVHLLNWSQALFHVKACNPVDGCSASNNVTVNHLKVDAIGFFKPPTSNGYLFGQQVALSADGKTLAVRNGETIGSATESLTTLVYRKTTPTSGWRLEARLLPTVIESGSTGFEPSDKMALSGDGSVLVVAGSPRSGTVHVYRRSGSTWQLSQTLSGSAVQGSFGAQVEIDDAAGTLVIRHSGPAGDAGDGSLEIYRSSGAGQPFVHAMTLPSIPPASAGAYAQCTYFALSGNGNTLIRNCSDGLSIYKYVHTGPSFAEAARFQSEGGTYGIDLSYDGTRTLLQDVQGAYSFVLGSGGWQQDGYLPDGEGEHDLGERRIALSRDGKIAAIGTYGDRRVGLGPLYPPYQLGTQETANGGVMVYQRKATGWAFRRLVKPGSANVGWAGFAVSLGQNGNVLAVGAPFDSSAATGVDGNRDDTSALNRGAVWLY